MTEDNFQKNIDKFAVQDPMQKYIKYIEDTHFGIKCYLDQLPNELLLTIGEYLKVYHPPQKYTPTKFKDLCKYLKSIDPGNTKFYACLTTFWYGMPVGKGIIHLTHIGSDCIVFRAVGNEKYIQVLSLSEYGYDILLNITYFDNDEEDSGGMAMNELELQPLFMTFKEAEIIIEKNKTIEPDVVKPQKCTEPVAEWARDVEDVEAKLINE